MFAYLLLEKNLDWYKKILQQTLGEHRDLNINPKNCIGTVIALNGFRKCFCVYHAKHPESSTNQRVSLAAFAEQILHHVFLMISCFGDNVRLPADQQQVLARFSDWRTVTLRTRTWKQGT